MNTFTTSGDLFPSAERPTLVEVIHDQPMTTTRRVAQMFNRPHKNVLRDVKELVERLPEGADRLNFEPITYVDDGGRQQPEYLVTRDGFALLAMSFTGREALRWKLAFIRAFNAMTKALQRQQRALLALQGLGHGVEGPDEGQLPAQRLAAREAHGQQGEAVAGDEVFRLLPAPVVHVGDRLKIEPIGALRQPLDQLFHVTQHVLVRTVEHLRDASRGGHGLIVDHLNQGRPFGAREQVARGGECIHAYSSSVRSARMAWVLIWLTRL